MGKQFTPKVNSKQIVENLFALSHLQRTQEIEGTKKKQRASDREREREKAHQP